METEDSETAIDRISDTTRKKTQQMYRITFERRPRAVQGCTVQHPREYRSRNESTRFSDLFVPQMSTENRNSVPTTKGDLRQTPHQHTSKLPDRGETTRYAVNICNPNSGGSTPAPEHR
jgi:hypothetical protein